MASRQLSNRLVAFFDILGFSRRLQRMGLEALHAEYAALLDTVTHEVFNQHEIVPAHQGQSEHTQAADNFALTRIVSDSIILVSHDASDITAVSRFVMASVHLMEKCFGSHFPVRGAIASGDILVDDEREILLSQCIPDLLAIEKRQEWSGCHIMANAESLVAEALFGARFVEQGMPPEARLPLVLYPVPLKEGEARQRLCLNWAYLMDHDELSAGLKHLIEPKREQTARFVEFVFSLPNQSQRLPADYAPAHHVRLLTTRSHFRPCSFGADGRHESLGGQAIPWIAWEA